MRLDKAGGIYGIAICFALLVASVSYGQNKDAGLYTADGAIKGTLDIDYKTRTELDTTGKYVEGSPQLGVKDTYKLALTVADTSEYRGTVTHQPRIETSGFKRDVQNEELAFSIDLIVRNPKNLDEKRSVGKWVGTVPIDPVTGIYSINGGEKQQSALRMDVRALGKAQAFVDKFSGKLIGKTAKEENYAAYTYKRWVGGKAVTIKAEKVDPMKFVDLALAKGPAEAYPKCLVNNRLDYDYETGNYLTEGVQFSYSMNGRDYKDIMTGSIKWVEDEDRATTGKGEYQLNLRFNEKDNQPAATESAAFEATSDEDAFFAEDLSIPCLTGTIKYEDTFISGTKTPSASKVTFNVNANKVTKVQLQNFAKLWLICVVPTNAE